MFLPQDGITEDAATTPIPATSTSGLAPSAASVLSGTESIHKQPNNAAKDDAAVLKEKNAEKGVWISADPLPGCVVCNIGESASQSLNHQASNVKVLTDTGSVGDLDKWIVQEYFAPCCSPRIKLSVCFNYS